MSVIHGECLSVKVMGGAIRKKDQLLMMPQQVMCTVKSIEYNKKGVDEVYSGQICELSI